jgi:hypothetical protein
MGDRYFHAPWEYSQGEDSLIFSDDAVPIKRAAVVRFKGGGPE